MTVFERTVIVDAKLSEVRDALAEDLPALASLLPDVKRIEALEVHVDDARGRLHRRDRWLGASRSPLLRTLLPESAVAWTVVSTWESDPFVVSWELVPITWPLRFGGRGRVAFEPTDRGRTRVIMEGELVTPEVSLSSALLVVSGPRLERIVADVVDRNIVALSARVSGFLASRRSQSRMVRAAEAGGARRSA